MGLHSKSDSIEKNVSTRLTALLVDESASDRGNLARLIARHPVLDLQQEADSAEAALEWLADHCPDVIFCEARFSRGPLPDFITGFPPSARIVVVSGDREFGWQAYELDAVDFLLKPVASERFASTVRRLMRIDWQPQVHPAPEPAKVMIPFERGRRSALLDEICQITACGSYSLVTLADGNSEIVLRSLVRWQQILPYGSFVQVHRSALVNRHRIQSFQQEAGDKTYRLKIADVAEPVPVSRRQAVFLKKLLFGNPA